MNGLGPAEFLETATRERLDMETWDEWQSAALGAGVSAELAQLGREVLRDYQQHGQDAEDSHHQQLGANGDYLQQLALQAPTQAFLDFNARLIWGDASGRDGDVEAFALLITQLGSQEAAEVALSREAPTVAALKQRYGHA